MIFHEIQQEQLEINTSIEKSKIKSSESELIQVDKRLYSPASQSQDSQSILKLKFAVLTCPSSGHQTDESYLKERYSEEVIDPYSLSCAGVEDEPFAGEDCDEVRGRAGFESQQNTDSTCASPDSKRLNEIQLFNSHKQVNVQFSLCNLLENSDKYSFSGEDLEGRQDPFDQPPVAAKINSQIFQPHKNVSSNLNLTFQSTKPRLSSSSLEGISSPFNFESKDRLSGKTDTTANSFHMTQERRNQKYCQGPQQDKMGMSSQQLDEVLEEEGTGCPNIKATHNEDSDYFQTALLLQSNQNGERKFARNLLEGCLNQSLNGRHQLLSSRNLQVHVSCTQLQDSLSGLRKEKDLIQIRYDQIQEKVFKYFDQEGIHTQAVGEAIHEINCSAFNGMGKLSPLKLDLTRSPLKRHRANTIQL